MNELTQIKCEACRVGAPKATEAEMKRYLPLIPEWKVIDDAGIHKLTRAYSFHNFESALAFTVLIGAVAEVEGHHPELLTEWGKVTVTWWTHKIKGLHVNDFIMAAKSDGEYT